MNVAANPKPTQQQNPMQWHKPAEPPKQKQETITNHSFWGTAPSNVSVDNSNKASMNKAVSFDDFFSTPATSSKAPEKARPQTTQNDMYDFFFPAS